MQTRTTKEILTCCVLKLNDRVEGGIPEPYRTNLFNIVGLNPNKSEKARESLKQDKDILKKR